MASNDFILEGELATRIVLHPWNHGILLPVFQADWINFSRRTWKRSTELQTHLAACYGRHSVVGVYDHRGVDCMLGEEGRFATFHFDEGNWDWQPEVLEHLIKMRNRMSRMVDRWEREEVEARAPLLEPWGQWYPNKGVLLVAIPRRFDDGELL